MFITLRQKKEFNAILNFDKKEKQAFFKKLSRCQVLEHDSRLVKKKSAFVALDGLTHLGVDFVEQIKDISPCILIDQKRKSQLDLQNNFFFVEDLKKKLARIVLAFYNWPSEKLKVIGITGTNGKTTISYILEKFYQSLKFKTGLIGTISNHLRGKEYTTPDLVDLQKMISQMVKKKLQVLLIEISSHALQLGRVQGLELDRVIWSNLSLDHLDFHGSLEKYFLAKFSVLKLLEQSKKKNKKAFICLDTLTSFAIQKKIKHFKTFKPYFLSQRKRKIVDANFTFSIKSSLSESCFVLQNKKQNWNFSTNLIGQHNGENLALSLMNLIEVKRFSSSIPKFHPLIQKVLKRITIPGRLEKIPLDKKAIFIDYAHTPDALQKVLQALKKLELPLICCFGCGGNRDHQKRALMGQVAIVHSEVVILTSDNPRWENPLSIIRDIEKGINTTIRKNKNLVKKKIYKIVNRQRAIFQGVKILKSFKASPAILLIAGKGHESYQVIKDQKINFDDKQIVQKLLTLT